MTPKQIIVLATPDGIYNVPIQLDQKLGEAVQTLQDVTLEAVCMDASGRGFAGATDGQIFRTESYGEWTQVSSGINKNSDLWTLISHPIRPSEIYAGLEPASVWISWDAGEHWEEIKAVREHPSSKNWKFYPPMKPRIRAISFSRDGSLMSVGIEEGGVLISGDGGRTFNDRTKGVDPDVHVIQASHADPSLIYTMTGEGLYRSRNAGAKWERMKNGLDRSYTVPLAMLAADGKVLCVGAAGKTPGQWKAEGADAAIYRSEDWGGTWVVAKGPFPLKGMIASIIVDPANREHILAGTNDGMLLQSKDLGNSWEIVARDLPRIEDMMICPR